jgi:energy-coupling factor transporter ATP-binding protein EcfA2
MDAFRREYGKDFIRAMPASVSTEERGAWKQSIADWLYNTGHIHIEYGIQYDGVAIEQLSPGTRGIVLLLLYLAVDRQDRRPLIVDQPEENLDPKSVYEELVPHFREARKRRQVIVVTHNANLVVNTDADQVIVATSTQTADGGLPTISYQSGSLENPNIRSAVCEILEGGERAFLERERRYRLRWGETIAIISDHAEETPG